MDWENFLLCGFTDWGCCTSGRAVERLVGWFCLPHLSRGRRWPTVLGSPIHYASIHPFKHASIHPSIQICNQPATPATPPPRRPRPAALSGSEQLLDEVAGHAVEEEAQHDEQQQGQHDLDDQPLVAVAHQVADGFQRAQEPQEGGVRATAGWGRGGFGSKCTEWGKKWDGTGREGTDMERGSGH